MSIRVHQHPERVGAVVEIEARDSSWHGLYRFLTAGMSDDEIRTRRDELAAHHAAKSARHDAFNSLNRTLTVGGQEFVIHGLGIDEQGSDVRLIIRVTTPDGSVLRLDVVAPTVAALPSDAQIVATARTAAETWIASRGDVRDHLDSVKQILGVS